RSGANQGAVLMTLIFLLLLISTCCSLPTIINTSIACDKIPLIGCETRRNDEGNYENEITVQNTERFDPKSDKRYLLTCIPASPIY
ncbi:hypothetical protein TELCIR_16395, partial [Teladorsagia circumcincta]